MSAITIQNISKNYGSVKALKDITLSIDEATIYGLIGPDGAGKTTLFRILTTLLLPDNGCAQIMNSDVVKDYRSIRKIVGYMPGRFSLYTDLTVEENLNFFAALFNTTLLENYDLIKDIYQQIEPFKNRLAGKLSGGMKQKLALCCALIHRPKVLFLDEPTTGVDPVSRSELWRMLKRLVQEGITIFVSTPYMDEAAQCDKVSLIRSGEILQTGTISELKESYPYPLFKVTSTEMYLLLKVLRQYDETISCYAFGDSLHLATRRTSVEIKKYLDQYFSFAVQIEKTDPSVEDCFMALISER